MLDLDPHDLGLGRRLSGDHERLLERERLDPRRELHGPDSTPTCSRLASLRDSDAARARLRELSDFAAPWAVSIAATLRLADHIEAGAVGLDDLAERAAVKPDALERLMRYLVAREVFVEEDGAYANTEVSNLLLDEVGWRPWLDLDDAPAIWAGSWWSLLEAVRTGSPNRDETWYEQANRPTGRSPLTRSWRAR